MRIKTMTATFGKLQNARLELAEGLNLIEAPNEGGKSTWCAFLRAMLYGIPTRERDTKGSVAEKNRYQPWTGGAMEGAVELTWGGKDITLRRGPKGSVPFASFSAVYTATGESVPGLTGENCGEKLLGVSREVFERSAFVGQGGASIGESGELQKRIAALVSTGEEDVSYPQVEGKLREWLRRRKFNKSGLLPKLDNELAVLDDTLSRQEQARVQAAESQREIESLVPKKDRLNADLTRWRGQAEREARVRWTAAQAALETARGDQAALERESAKLPPRDTLKAAQGDLAYYSTVEANRKLAEGQIEGARAAAMAAKSAARAPLFPDMTPDDAWMQAGRDRDRAAAKPPKTPVFAASVALMAVTALWFAGLLLLLWGGRGVPAWVYCVLAVAAGLTLASVIVAAKQSRSWRAETTALLAHYGVDSPDAIPPLATAYREKHAAAQEAARNAEAVERSAAELATQKECLLGELLALVRPFAPTVTDFFGVSAAISKGLVLQEKLAEARVRLEGAVALAESLPRPELSRTGPAYPEGEALPAQAEEFTPGFSPEETAARLSAMEGELSRLRSALAMAQGELNTLGDPILFEARRGELREERERREEEYAALTLALEGLRDANAELQERFSPALNERAGAILSALTGGKYGQLTLDRAFEAQAREADSPLPRRALLLSQGTAEQVYLAARLAVCALALPSADPAPLVLDDALDAFDDTRMALALDFLGGLGTERQVLLFTCHARERVYLDKKGGTAILRLPSA